MTLKPRLSPSRGHNNGSISLDEQPCTPTRANKSRKESRNGSTAKWLPIVFLTIGFSVLVTLSPLLGDATSSRSSRLMVSSEEVPLLKKSLLSADTVPKDRDFHHHQAHHVYDVLIVGAGWAGLAAASTLQKHGLDNFVVLEGRDDVGGRSRTIYPFSSAPDLPVELGSSWTYNDTEPHEWMLEQELPYGEVHYEDIDTWGLYFAAEPGQPGTGGGGLANAKKAKRYDDFWSEYAEFSAEEGERLEESGVDQPYQAILDAYLAKHSTATGKQKNKKKQLTAKERLFLKTMVHAQIEIEYAATVQRISGTFSSDAVNECIFCHADNFVPVQGGGFDKILQPLVEPVQDKIQLRRKVTRVEYVEEVARVVYTDDQGRQHTKLAKTVLMTVPLGVLQKQTIDFQPPLPQAKQDAINVIGFGILNKCVLYWQGDQSSWWPEGKEVLTYVPSSEDEVGSFTTFFNDKQLGNGDHFVLSAWTAGESAKAMERLSDAATVKLVLANLRSMMGSDKHHRVPPPSNHAISRWGQDEFAYGAYSYVTVGRESLVDSARRELGARTGDKLFWAGEATHATWSGSTVGAYRSGVSAAEDMLLTLRHRLGGGNQDPQQPQKIQSSRRRRQQRKRRLSKANY